ncbi:MAG: hypothetical protein ACM3QS_10355 [Bacteroidota bacterium]
MNATLSSSRRTGSYVMVALAVVLVMSAVLAIRAFIAAPRHAVIPATGGQNAQALFRQEELSLYNRPAASSVGGPAFFEYRRGEWSTHSVDAMGQFRQEELSLYDRPAASDLADPAFHRYLSTTGSALADPAFHRYLSTQGLGK